MVCVLRFGPHDHEHFTWDQYTPPKTIAIQSQPGQSSVYMFERFEEGQPVYEYQDTVPRRIYGMVEYIEYDEMSANRPQRKMN